MAYSTILVTGGTGFIGSHLVAQLARTERDIIVPTRHAPRGRHLIVLPGVNVVEANVHDQAELNRLVRGVDAVINLVGILHSKAGARGTPYGPQFARAHVELPRKIVAACLENGVHRYLHMSALGAAENGPSMYLRSKAAGEAAALSSPGLAVTIFRPSVVFGEEDKFLNRFASLQRFFPIVPLAAADAKFQPVYVKDVAHAFVTALEDREAVGKRVELVGPKVYTLRELVRLAGFYSGHPRPVVGLPDWLARLQALLMELMPGDPLLSRDNLDSMKNDNIASSPKVIPQPTAVEAVAPYYLG
jgi:NADH dehydrogenase